MRPLVLMRCQSLCPSGRYGSEPALTTKNCSGPCEKGYECPDGSTAPQTSMCPPGYFCAGGPKQPCPAGRYSARNGTESLDACILCPASTYSGVVAASSEDTCQPCPRFEGSNPGAMECWPGVVSAIASNPPVVLMGLSVGDVVTLNFTRRTSQPVDILDKVEFAPSIGVLQPSWRAQGKVLQLTVTSVAGIALSAVDVVNGAVSVSVRGLLSASGLSQVSEEVAVVVGGSWGMPTPPVIIAATAYDSGMNAGLWTNDTLLLAFDQAVQQVLSCTCGQLLAGCLLCC